MIVTSSLTIISVGEIIFSTKEIRFLNLGFHFAAPDITETDFDTEIIAGAVCAGVVITTFITFVVCLKM